MIELEWLWVRNEGCPSIPPHSQQAPSAQVDTCLSNIPSCLIHSVASEGVGLGLQLRKRTCHPDREGINL